MIEMTPEYERGFAAGLHQRADKIGRILPPVACEQIGLAVLFWAEHLDKHDPEMDRDEKARSIGSYAAESIPALRVLGEHVIQQGYAQFLADKIEDLRRTIEGMQDNLDATNSSLGMARIEVARARSEEREACAREVDRLSDEQERQGHFLSADLLHDAAIAIRSRTETTEGGA